MSIQILTPGEADEANVPVSTDTVIHFLTSMGFSPDAARRFRRIRVEPDVIQVTVLRHDESGHYFIDETTGRPAEVHYVMPVVR